MMQQLFKTLPDDRPITSITVVEDPEKCPAGYTVVSRTHDQDSDADLWREAKVFGRKVTRYVCHSKTEGRTDYIVESVTIVNERDIPPEGYSVLTRTADTDQKAWRKRQLCYRLAKLSEAVTAVTDIIVLSARLKRAPDGFLLAGEINGMTVCFKRKLGLNLSSNKVPTSNFFLSLNSPAGGQTDLNSQPLSYPALPTKPTANVPYPITPKQNSVDTSPHEYEQLVNLRPSRPAPRPPGLGNDSNTNYATLSAYHGLEGVPFILNPVLLNNSHFHQIPSIKIKTKYQLDKEFDYDFRIERQT